MAKEYVYIAVPIENYICDENFGIERQGPLSRNDFRLRS